MQSHKKSLSQNLNCNQNLSNLLPKENLMPILKHKVINFNQGFESANLNHSKSIIESRNSLQNVDNSLKLNGLQTIGDHQPLNPSYFKLKQSKLEQIDERTIKEESKEKKKLRFTFAKTKKSSNYSLSKVGNLIQSQCIKEIVTHSTQSKDKVNLKGNLSYSIQDYSQVYNTSTLQNDYSRYENKRDYCLECDDLKEEIRELKKENKQLHRQFMEISNNYSEAIKELNNTRRKYESRIESLKNCLAFLTNKFKCIRGSVIKLNNQAEQFIAERLPLKSRSEFNYFLRNRSI